MLSILQQLKNCKSISQMGFVEVDIEIKAKLAFAPFVCEHSLLSTFHNFFNMEVESKKTLLSLHMYEKIMDSAQKWMLMDKGSESP